MDDKQLFEKMYPTTPDKVGLAYRAIVAVALFTGSVRSVRKGEVDKAIYKAVLWSGWSRNNTADFFVRYDRAKGKETKPDAQPIPVRNVVFNS